MKITVRYLKPRKTKAGDPLRVHHVQWTSFGKGIYGLHVSFNRRMSASGVYSDDRHMTGLCFDLGREMDVVMVCLHPEHVLERDLIITGEMSKSSYMATLINRKIYDANPWQRKYPKARKK